MCFVDSGCNCWIALDGIPQNELKSVKLREGPISLGVASGIEAQAEAEWSSLLPLADGTYQTVRGLTMKKVTSDMPLVDLNPVLEVIKKDCPGDARIKNLKVPKFVGGTIHMILGVQYQSIYPEPLHTMSNGLTLFKSKLLPSSPGMLACIGGPISRLEHICSSKGSKSTLSYMSHLVQRRNDHPFRMEFFPDLHRSFPADKDIPDIQEFDDDGSESFDYDENSFADESFDLHNSHQSPLIMKYKPVSCEVCEEPFLCCSIRN